MAFNKLHNYLRAFRKRSGLSQAEVAYLLGCQEGSKVSRYEHFRREPSLAGALAYEVIFGVPVRELFAGLFRKVERNTLRRIGNLGQKLHSTTKPTRLVAQKLETLATALKRSRTRGGSYNNV